MADGICTIGDTTSHGGEILTGSSHHRIRGKGIARLYDKVSCPIHGENRIAQVKGLYRLDGRPGAVDGDVTECGAKLISSHAGTATVSDA